MIFLEAMDQKNSLFLQPEAGESAAQEEAPATPAVVDPAQAHTQASVEADVRHSSSLRD